MRPAHGPISVSAEPAKKVNRFLLLGKKTLAKILLVEDNEMNRDMLSRRLERKGFIVILAVDGDEGISLARKESPDLILMDMSLPGTDGWQASKIICYGF